MGERIERRALQLARQIVVNEGDEAAPVTDRPHLTSPFASRVALIISLEDLRAVTKWPALTVASDASPNLQKEQVWAALVNDLCEVDVMHIDVMRRCCSANDFLHLLGLQVVFVLQIGNYESAHFRGLLASVVVLMPGAHSASSMRNGDSHLGHFARSVPCAATGQMLALIVPGCVDGPPPGTHTLYPTCSSRHTPHRGHFEIQHESD
jgi:hypothetical protein